MLHRRFIVGWILIPLLFIAIFIGLASYFVLNPEGGMAEKLLNKDNMITLINEQLRMVGVSAGLAIAVAVPAGIIVSRPRFRSIGFVLENVANIGQTVPPIAVLALFFTALGLGFNTAVFALWLYSLLPILRNTCAGLKGVSNNVIESARGMGMTPFRILTQIELPLAIPIIMAGIRTAIVINVGTATMATFVGAGGLGDLIVSGISVQRIQLIIAGSSLSAVMAIFFDHIFGQVEAHLK